jgi:hypothetical protein
MPVAFLAVLAITLYPAVGRPAALTSVTCLAKEARDRGHIPQVPRNACREAARGQAPPIGNKCTTTFDEKRVKLDAQAAAAAVACRFIDNGDGTVTDVDTGLQWEQKNASDTVEDPSNPHDVDNRYLWSAPSDTSFSRSGTVFTDFLELKCGIP